LPAQIARLVTGDQLGPIRIGIRRRIPVHGLYAFQTTPRSPARRRTLLHAFATSAISASMSLAELCLRSRRIGVAVADAGVAHGQPFQSELVNHASGGSARWVLEDAAGAFLAQRLARSPFFVADTNTFEDSLNGLEVVPMSPRASYHQAQKKCAGIRKKFDARAEFGSSVRSAVELHLAHVRPICMP